MATDRFSTLREAFQGAGQAGNKEPSAQAPITLNIASIDTALGGGLARGGLHDIYAATTAHHASATGFAAALAVRAAQGKPILWVRQDFLDTETGRLNAAGLAAFGLDPSHLILVRARDVEGVLRAGEQALGCAALGAVLIEPWGAPRLLDLKASRRLSLASAKSEVPILMLRVAASPAPSAAATRWVVHPLPSRPLAAHAPGFPAFGLQLIRQRGGVAGQSWSVEWNRDQQSFQQRRVQQESIQEQRWPIAAPLSRAVVSVSPHRPGAADLYHPQFRRTANGAGLAAGHNPGRDTASGSVRRAR